MHTRPPAAASTSALPAPTARPPRPGKAAAEVQEYGELLHRYPVPASRGPLDSFDSIATASDGECA